MWRSEETEAAFLPNPTHQNGCTRPWIRLLPFLYDNQADTGIHFNKISPEFKWIVLQWELTESFSFHPILILPLMTLTSRNVISLTHIQITQKDMKFRAPFRGLNVNSRFLRKKPSRKDLLISTAFRANIAEVINHNTTSRNTSNWNIMLNLYRSKFYLSLLSSMCQLSPLELCSSLKKKEQINMELFCATMKYMLIIVQPHRNQKETKGGIWEEQETLKLGLYSNYLEIPLREVVQIEPE